MTDLKGLQDLFRTLRLAETASQLPELIKKAETKELSYQKFLLEVMGYEQKRREEKMFEKRLKRAAFPYIKRLDEFNLSEQTSLSQKQFN